MFAGYKFNDDQEKYENRYISIPTLFFSNRSQCINLENDLYREIIKDIDHCEVIGPQVVMHERGFSLSIRDLCGGTQTLLLMNEYPDKIFNASYCVGNCTKYILEIAEKDITIVLRHSMKVHILNCNKITINPFDLYATAYDYLYAENRRYYDWN